MMPLALQPSARVAPPAARVLKVFVVDDHPVFRRGVEAALETHAGLQWVGGASGAAEAVRMAPLLEPDVVLVDLVMPDVDGVATIEALRSCLPLAQFVAVTCRLQPTLIRAAVLAGASSVLVKTAGNPEFFAAIEAAMRGEALHSPEVWKLLSEQANDSLLEISLTQREHHLLTLMAQGLSNLDISRRLDIALPTVKFHVTNILAKLNAENRTAAVLTALRHRLVTMDQGLESSLAGASS